MNKDDNLDLLDLNDDADTMDTLPDAVPFAQPRPKKPWLLLAVGVVVIILATYIIIRTIGGDSTSKMEVDLDGPAIMVEGGDAAVPVQMDVPPQPVNVAPAPQPVQAAVQPAPAVQTGPQPVAQNTTPGVPVRVVEDRKDVTFNPNKPATQPAKQAVKKTSSKPASQPARRTQTQRAQTAPKASAWYAQIGSYSSRALAEAGQRKLQNSHKNLFSGHQFVILAAVLPNGSTTYRLRIGFNAAADANSFCRNAKADGLECYVTK